MHILFIFFLGGNRFIKDIEMMIGTKKWIFWLWWRACWFVATPILLSVSKNIEFQLIICRNL